MLDYLLTTQLSFNRCANYGGVHSAHDIATERGHKTISATHVADAVKQLNWDDGSQLLEAMRRELVGWFFLPSFRSPSMPDVSYLLRRRVPQNKRSESQARET